MDEDIRREKIKLTDPTLVCEIKEKEEVEQRIGNDVNIKWKYVM